VRFYKYGWTPKPTRDIRREYAAHGARGHLGLVFGACDANSAGGAALIRWRIVAGSFERTVVRQSGNPYHPMSDRMRGVYSTCLAISAVSACLTPLPAAERLGLKLSAAGGAAVGIEDKTAQRTILRNSTLLQARTRYQCVCLQLARNNPLTTVSCTTWCSAIRLTTICSRQSCKS